jgi:hypothetical protein
MKNAKRWIGIAIAAVVVILAVMQWVRSSSPAQLPVSDPAGQQTGQIDDGNNPIDLPVTDPTDDPSDDPADDPKDDQPQTLAEDGVYTTKDDVALYLHLYGHLPGNFITKRDAEDLGWSGGSLEPYAPGKCIGGDRFGNYEKLLPVKDGRRYQECDIDTLGANSRGAKRIVFSNDGLIYYTEDHYNTFTLLYGEEEG